MSSYNNNITLTQSWMLSHMSEYDPAPLYLTDFIIEMWQVGTWHDQYGIKFVRNFTSTYSEIVESLQNKTLVVTTIVVTQLNFTTFDYYTSYCSLHLTACLRNHPKNLLVMMHLKDMQLTW